MWKTHENPRIQLLFGDGFDHLLIVLIVILGMVLLALPHITDDPLLGTLQHLQAVSNRRTPSAAPVGWVRCHGKIICKPPFQKRPVGWFFHKVWFTSVSELDLNFDLWPGIRPWSERFKKLTPPQVSMHDLLSDLECRNPPSCCTLRKEGHISRILKMRHDMIR